MPKRNVGENVIKIPFGCIAIVAAWNLSFRIGANCGFVNNALADIGRAYTGNIEPWDILSSNAADIGSDS